MQTHSANQLTPGLEDLPAREAVRLLEQAIRQQSGSPTDHISEADEQVARALNDGRYGDELIAAIDLPTLATLVDRVHAAIADSQLTSPPSAATRTAWTLLDVLRRSALLRRISSAGLSDEWAQRMLKLIVGSHFTFGQLFAQRAAAYSDRELFILPGGRTLGWHHVAQRVNLFARALLAVTGDEPEGPVAILSHNSLEMALADLACLSTGIVNVMIPATATATDVKYILGHAEVSTVLVAANDQVDKVLAARPQVPSLKRIIRLDADPAAHPEVTPVTEILERAATVSPEAVAHRRNRVCTDDLATIMYTSGTTGTPKGIAFTQLNMVFKRFARALAIPEIGDNDRYLSYLPLFHTFGRFLELQGAIFWGATYCFAGDPSIETLTSEMSRLKPSIFISIPMKWIQLYELVQRSVDLQSADDESISEAVRRLTGGRLRWGLSAAGYLDPEVFRFFQGQGIELMSGFGMTEATGGITMTPPGEYRDDSLGRALPGIEVTLAEDGELLMRGAYVMRGYFKPPDGQPSFDEKGWLHSGDLMEQDAEGFYRIIDRKKEIYKNVKGQTVAPQKIENLFRDFPSVGRVFLVGDHRPYNTALIFPNTDFEELDLEALSAEELHTHFRSIVVTANTFLAPFERIVDFAVIDRDFSLEQGELTPKGTLRRKTIERNLADTIRLLYRRTTLTVSGVEVTVANWIFQELGITTHDVRSETNELRMAPSGATLRVRRVTEDEVQIGAAVYRIGGRFVDLGTLLATPRLWLGNAELVDFAPLGLELRDRRRWRPVEIVWLRPAERFRASQEDRDTVEALLLKQDVGLLDLHRAGVLLEAEEAADALLAVRALKHAVHSKEGTLGDMARRLLRRAAGSPSVEVARRAFEVLVFSERQPLYQSTLASFFDGQPELVDADTTAILVERDLSPEQIASLMSETEERCRNATAASTELATAQSLLALLASYGTVHPSQYRGLRAFLTRMAITSSSLEIQEAARDSRAELEVAFRIWLGAPSRVAIDPETGLEYRWEDVVAFSDEVPEDDRSRILSAITSTAIIREGAYFFSAAAAVRLPDILPGGVWIRRLGADYGKTVYRLAVRTRDKDTFDLALNLNHGLSDDQVEEEIEWLIACSDANRVRPLVEHFGGYWPEHGLWTEEFIPGETLDRALKRLARRPEDLDRFQTLWPFSAWSALGAYVEFWNRTGRRLVIADPVPCNVIVPTHDYHTGARLVSIAARCRFESIASMLYALRDRFITTVEEQHPGLGGLAGWDIIFSALIEIVGEDEGLSLLTAALDDQDRPRDDFREAAPSFMAAVQRRGFLPRRLFFAGKRFRRWQRLNEDATRFARARTLQELYDTYGLEELLISYPEARARFFRETVFRDSPAALADGLEEIIDQLRSGKLLRDGLSAAVADLRAHLEPGTDEDFFLARLSFPFLRPEDEAGYVAAQAGGLQQSEMVVTHEDADGDPYWIRHALSAKEVGRLHSLFLAAKLTVQFRPEHRFLIAVNGRGHLIGGLFYEVLDEERTAHMDKIVVAQAFQRKGVAGELLEELCNRLRTGGIHSLTTGFFRPQFFYRFGFAVERRYAGLVKVLTDNENGATGSQ